MVKSTKQKAIEAQVRHELREEREERARQKKEIVKATNKDVAPTRSRVKTLTKKARMWLITHC
eukprot:8971789-Pyramimonas_sp.AAC.1